MTIMRCGAGGFEFEVIRFKAGFDRDEVLDFLEGSNPNVIGENGPISYYDSGNEWSVHLFPLMTKTWLIKDQEGKIFHTDKNLFSKLQELSSNMAQE